MSDLEYYKHFNWNELLISPTISIEQMIEIIQLVQYALFYSNLKKRRVVIKEITINLVK